MAEKEVRLIDANALIQAFWDDIANGNQYDYSDTEELINNAPTIDPESLRPQWIGVNDRLPEQCGMGCLLCGTNCYGQQRVFEGFTGYMEGGKFQWHTNLKDINLDVWNVTHWMPLPNPPEKQ